MHSVFKVTDSNGGQSNKDYLIIPNYSAEQAFSSTHSGTKIDILDYKGKIPQKFLNPPPAAAASSSSAAAPKKPTQNFEPHVRLTGSLDTNPAGNSTVSCKPRKRASRSKRGKAANPSGSSTLVSKPRKRGSSSKMGKAANPSGSSTMGYKGKIPQQFVNLFSPPPPEAPKKKELVVKLTRIDTMATYPLGCSTVILIPKKRVSSSKREGEKDSDATEVYSKVTEFDFAPLAKQ